VLEVTAAGNVLGTYLSEFNTALMNVNIALGSPQGAREVQQLLQVFVGELRLHQVLASLLAWLQQQPELSQQQQQEFGSASVVSGCANAPLTLKCCWQWCVAAWSVCITSAQRSAEALPGADVSTDSKVLAFKSALVAAGEVAAAAAAVPALAGRCTS
jgi:hypothetical protein